MCMGEIEFMQSYSSTPKMKMITMNNFSEDSCYEMNQSKFQNDKN